MVSAITYRLAQQKDLAGAYAIWQEVFGDSAQEAEGYIRRFVGLENLYVAAEEEGPVAILSAVPCACEGQAGVYLFALATIPSRRGRGLMAALMDYAEAQSKAAGAAFSCLIPAEGSLFGYYQRQGYETVWTRAVAFTASGLRGEEVRQHALCSDILDEMREKYLPGAYVAFSKPRTELLLQAAGQGGCRLAQGTGAYAVYLPKPGGLAVPELGADSQQAAHKLLEDLCHVAGSAKALITLPKASALFAGQGELWPLAAQKSLNGSPLGEGGYLRFGLDELFEKDFENLALMHF